MTTIAVGNKRLLRLADILDKADALHKERGEPTYAQYRVMHECGTPACALGHWAYNNPRRWKFNSRGAESRETRLTAVVKNGMYEFSLSYEESDALFGVDADHPTAKSVAKYIRAFVKRRSQC